MNQSGAVLEKHTSRCHVNRENAVKSNVAESDGYDKYGEG